MSKLICLLQNLLFPPKCESCLNLLPIKDYFSQSDVLCPTCKKQFEEETKEVCTACHKPVSECLCVTESMKAVGINAFFKLCYYKETETVQNRIVFHLKETMVNVGANFFAERLAIILKKQAITLDNVVITYLPRSRQSYRKYGTDQGKEIAMALSKKMQIPFIPLLDRAKGNDKTQKRLSFAQRRENASHAFVLSKNIPDLNGKTILLVDDIVTSGFSMASGAKQLYKAGAKKVVSVAPLSNYTNQTRTVNTGENI